MSEALTPSILAAPASQKLRRRRVGRGRAVVLLGLCIAVFLLSPLALLAIDAHSAGWGEIHHVLFRARSYLLLRHTVVLTLLVAAFAATLGVATAWCTERTRLPARRVWTVLLVLPIAIPDDVVGYAWHTTFPGMSGLMAATLVMTLGTYPLVYLPVAAALRRSDPAMQDTAYSLGAGRLRTFLRITLPLIRTAVMGGCVLVALTTISEYGTFEIVRYQTFTTEVFTEFQFNSRAASALSVPLVCLALLVLAVDGIVPSRAATRIAPSRAAVRARLRWLLAPTLGALMTLVAFAIVFPIGIVVYWMAQSQHTTLPAAATLGQATWNSLIYSVLGASAAVVLALPVALVSFRRSTRPRRMLQSGTYIPLALPGVVVALSLVFFATRYAYSLYQTSFLLIVAYAIMHFPLALVCIRASAAQAPARLADVGLSLGRGPFVVFMRVTLPQLLPGILAGFCLVFLFAVTELTATLLLAPIGVQTLATQFWAYQSEVSYGAAAPYALMIIVLAALPAVVLALWFDRGRFQPQLAPL
ncbi:MAG TPA: iron ABC transporter permease [Solirubrobacteraceae bacterium]|jgi:iron(III) transport system permease protein|nr:iron ABC transporter permease [Solirubrobacteraceae bacterium]